MVELVFRDFGETRKRRAKPEYKKVRRADGSVEALYKVDLASPSFGNQFDAAFRSSVAQARRENKKLFGASDVRPKKG